jgi:CheY-like chemotaxis protein
MKFRKSESGTAVDNFSDPVSMQNLRGMKILVVEDNVINLKIICGLLSKWDARIDTAEDGEVAVQKVRNNTYDLILMDLSMPRVSGFEAAMQIRNTEGDYYKNIPILALTASAFVEDHKRIFESGMNGFIIKPFHPAELNSKISNFHKGTMLLR